MMGAPKLIARIVAAGTALTNSTTETVLASYALATSQPLPANFWTVGKQIKIRALVRATATNSTDTLQVRVRMGPTTITGTVIFDSTAVDAADNDVTYVDLTVTCRTVGTSGVLEVMGGGSIEGVAGTATVRARRAAVTSYDTTIDQRIEVTGTWSVASASNSCQAESFEIYEAV